MKESLIVVHQDRGPGSNVNGEIQAREVDGWELVDVPLVWKGEENTVYHLLFQREKEPPASAPRHSSRCQCDECEADPDFAPEPRTLYPRTPL